MARRAAPAARPEVDPDVVKRLAELVDGDAWALADYLVEQFPEETFGHPSEEARTGLRAALARYQGVLYNEYGVDLTANTMRIYRATALRWPGDTRVSPASFQSHKLLRGDDRFDRMRRYVRANRGQALSARTVSRMRADEAPGRPARSLDEQMRAGIARAVRRVLLAGIVTKQDDWWRAATVNADMRATAVRELRALAGRIEEAG